jgi:hypothetical protein
MEEEVAAGHCAEHMGEVARVLPGMYWIRLTHGGRSLTARGVVLRQGRRIQPSFSK